MDVLTGEGPGSLCQHGCVAISHNRQPHTFGRSSAFLELKSWKSRQTLLPERHYCAILTPFMSFRRAFIYQIIRVLQRAIVADCIKVSRVSHSEYSVGDS